MAIQTATQTAAPKRARKLTTPQLLKIGLYVTWGASFLMLVSAIAGIQAQRNGMKSMTQRAIPNVIVAQRLKTVMADIDSIVANQLVEESLTMSQSDLEEYMRRRGDLAERMLIAARNLSLGEAEQEPLENIFLNFSNYMAQAERARFAKERGDRIAMLAAYRQASQILDEKLLPDADRFAQVNEIALERSYEEAQAARNLYLVLIILSGVFLISSLIVLQVFITRRTRRTFNPLLVTATVFAFILLGHTVALMQTSQTLQFLKEDVYGAIRALRLGRVQLYLADVAKSRFLLDQALSTQHQTAFYQHRDQVLKVSGATSLETVINALRNGQTVPGVTGYFAESIQRANSPKEQTALLTMLEHYAQYLEIDRQIRQLALSGQREAAIALSTGREPGQSQWAFAKLLVSNEEVREDIYVETFEQVTSRSLQSLDGFEITATTTTVAIALLILFGLRPRLMEYFL